MSVSLESSVGSLSEITFPQSKNLRYSFSLKELIDNNFDVKLEEVNCTVCRKKTNQVRKSTINGDFLIVELMRENRGLKVNRASIYFDANKILFPRSSSTYQVIATAHHSGVISSGPWKVKLKTSSGWIFMDSGIVSTNPPGSQHDDGSLSLLILKKNN